MSLILSICDKSYLVQVLLIIKIFFKIACILVPIVIAIASVITFTKAIQTGDEADLKTGGQLLVKRLIAGLIILFLPALISAFINNIDAAKQVDFLACFDSASKEMVERLKAKEEAEAKAEAAAQDKEDEKTLREAYEKEMKEKGARQQSFEEWKKEHEANNSNGGGDVQVSTGGIDAQAFKNKLSSMSTPTMAQLESAAAKNGISKDYLIIIIGTTQNEGYVNDPYLNYGWASAMINVPVSISQMQGWDPSRSGEANFYSQTNINRGYNNASDAVLKSVYLALTERNTKIVECNGMYKTTPSSYNLLYSSPVYNCSIYERKG